MNNNTRLFRIIDFTPNLGMGGIATGMIRVLETIDHSKYKIDFLLFDHGEHYYASRAEALGSQIYYISSPKKNPIKFIYGFIKTLKENGPFDIMHAHPYSFCGLAVFLGWVAGVPIRISHAHNDHRHTKRAKPLLKRAYTRLMQLLISVFSTCGLAISEEAAQALFGKHWNDKERITIIPVGTDFKPFEDTYDAHALRAEYGLTPSDKVIGVIGRFVPQKNHAFVMDIAAALHTKNPDVKFLFIGDGPLKEDMQRKAEALGIAGGCIFAGVQENVPAILTHVIDTVFFPSLHEGLGRVAVEGQAAGLPVVASEHIPAIAGIDGGNVVRLSLTAPHAQWVDALETALTQKRRPIEDAVAAAKASPLSIEHHIKNLEDFYAVQIRKAGLNSPPTAHH